MIQILYSIKHLNSNPIIKKLINSGYSISSIKSHELKNSAIFITDNLNHKDIEKITKGNITFLQILIILSEKINLGETYTYFDHINSIIKRKNIDVLYQIYSLENLNFDDCVDKFISYVLDKVYVGLQDTEFVNIPVLFVEKLKDYLVIDEIYFLSFNPFNELIKSHPPGCPRYIKEIFRKKIILHKINRSTENSLTFGNKNSKDFMIFSSYHSEMLCSFVALYLKCSNIIPDPTKPNILQKFIRVLDDINSKLVVSYRLQRNIEEIRALHNVSVAFGATTGVDELIHLIVKKSKNVFNADVVTLMLVEDDELYIKYSLGLPENLRGIRQKVGQGIAGNVAKTGKPIIINDIDKVQDKFDFEKNYKSSIVVPLKVKEKKVIGVLSVSKHSFYPFSQSDMQTLENLATVAANAIEKAQLYENLNIYSQKLEESYINTIKSLAKAFEARDKYNKGHMERVLRYGLAIAAELDSSLLNDDVLKLSLLFHDIGKIEIPDSILNKPSKLTPEEYEIIKRHPEAGEEILKNVKFLHEVAEIVKQHQERWDGKGYPRGLKGEEIHLYARIVALADAFDAMTSDRVYRKGMSIEEAVEEIKRNRGTQFDPLVVDAFLRAYQNGLIKLDEQINQEIVESINIKRLKEKG